MTAAEQPNNPGLLEAARELVENLGVKIVLLHGVRTTGCTCGKAKCLSAGKHPRHTDWKTEATNDLSTVSDWISNFGYLNLGWVPGNQYVVIDIDPRNGGIDSYRKLQHLLPLSRSHITGGRAVNGIRGKHLIYLRPEGVRLNQGGKLAPGIDFKTGTGALLVAPGSRTEGPYLASHTEIGIVALPKDTLQLILGGKAADARDSGLRDRYGEPILAGGREDELIRYAGDLARRVNLKHHTEREAQDLMRHRWEDTQSLPNGDNVTVEKALSMLDRMITKDQRRDDDPLEPVEDPTLADGFLANDIGNSQRLLDHIRGQAKWVDTWGCWVVYRGGAWRLDPNRVLMLELAKEMVVAMRQWAAVQPKKPREALWRWANESSKVKNLEAMVKMARGATEVFITHHELNQQPNLFNTLSGTVDLTTNDLLPHSPNHLLTAQAPVEYNPEAQSPRWQSFVEQVMPDPDVRRFLQKAVGSGLIGHAVQHLFICWGGGGNGKGVFFNTCSEVLGPDYYVIPHQGLITMQRHAQHDTVKASLYNKRMAVASETSEHDRLNEANIKDLTGADMLAARRMRENEWHFWPVYTMFMHTNYKPLIRGTDEGIWRRVFLIPWTVTIPVRERDDQLKSKLLEERSGILNWLLEGCAAFLQEGFSNPPEQVRAATEEYRSESDLIGRFFADAGIRADPGGWETSSDLQRRWQSWCEAENLKMPPPWKRVANRLLGLGAEPATRKINGKSPRGYRGISLADSMRGA